MRARTLNVRAFFFQTLYSCLSDSGALVPPGQAPMAGHWRADGSGGRFHVRTWEQSDCLPSKHGQEPARLPALRTRGPSSLQGRHPSQALGGPTALEAACRFGLGNSLVACLQIMDRDRQGCPPCGLGGPRPSRVGTHRRPLEGRRLWRPLAGSDLGTVWLPAFKAWTGTGKAARIADSGALVPPG